MSQSIIQSYCCQQHHCHHQYTHSTTTDDADVPRRSQTITIPIEVYDAATAIDTNTTTSTNTYEEEMMDTEEAPLYEPYVSERSMENRATADFSNVYDSDVVKAHWKKLKDCKY